MLARKHILVVDDDEPTARMLARYLEAYVVSIAYDGVEALEMARRAPPDLVLTDVWMPRMDGIQLVAAMKADPELHHVPVVFLTAVADAPHIAQAISAGAKHFLRKPISTEKLLHLVQHDMGLG